MISRPSASFPGVFESSVLASRCISCKQKIELLADFGGAGEQRFELLHVAREARQFFGDVAAFGGERCFLREARGIELRIAEQFLQACFETAREGRARAFREDCDFGREARDAFQAAGHFLAQRFGFVLAHAIELVERFAEALRDDRLRGAAISSSSDARAGPITPGRRRIEARSGSAWIRTSPRSEFDGFEVCRGDFLIDPHGRRAREFVVKRDIEMAAADAFANNLAHARFERLEALRHAQVQIQEAVIHAAQGDAQAAAALDGCCACA